MKEASTRLTERAADLREAFDRSFAASPPARPESTQDFLAIHVGANAYALRLSEIASLFANREVVRLPGRVPGLLGITSVGTSIVAVYDLGVLLGMSDRRDVPRWSARAAADAVALAFDEFDGYVRVSSEQTLTTSVPADGLGFVRHGIQSGTVVRPIIQIAPLLDVLRQRAQQGSTPVHPRSATP